MSQGSRKSSRPSSVFKRDQLEATLATRKAESEIKALKTRSLALETVHRQELEAYEEEAMKTV